MIDVFGVITKWYYKLALRVADSSTHNTKMGAVVFKGGCVLSLAPNLSAPVGSAFRGKHAEARALPPHRDFQGATICVARDGGKMSRPCKDCLLKIKTAGIVRMIYADWNGNLVEEKVS